MASPVGSPRAPPPDLDDRFAELAVNARSNKQSISELGFRSPAPAPDTPIPDLHGLGWPGDYPLIWALLLSGADAVASTAKSTVLRLNQTPEERAAREAKLAGAVRTLLEGIGEDPDREGLLRTPERYAQALLWMTKGYEERLSGDCFATCYHLVQSYSTTIPAYLPRGH